MSHNERIHNVGASNKHLLLCNSTVSSILQSIYKAEIRKTILNYTKYTEAGPQKNTAHKKTCKTFSASSTRTDILRWKYVNEKIF